MKSKKIFIILIIVAIVSLIIFCSICLYNQNKSMKHNSEANLTEVANATIEKTSINMLVSENTDFVQLGSSVSVGENCTWFLTYDIQGTQIIPTKVASGINGKLNDGNNIFYIFVTNNTYSKTQVYTLNVYKKYYVNVTYYFNRQILKTDKILTGTTLKLSPIDLPGYTFNYWENLNGTKIESTEIWTSENFYANVSCSSYVVTLDINHGNFLPTTNYTLTYTKSFKLPTPTRDGYSFKGWYYKEKQVTDNEGNSLITTFTTVNTILTAHWEANKGTTIIKYYINNEECANIQKENEKSYKIFYTKNTEDYYCSYKIANAVYNSSVKFDSHESIKINLNSGFKFIGWYDEDNNFISSETTLSYISAINNVFIAKFDFETYRVTFDFVGGKQLQVNYVDVKYLSYFELPSTTKVGYTFDGWLKSEKKYSKYASVAQMIWTEDIILKTEWIPKKYPVIVKSNLESAANITFPLSADYDSDCCINIEIFNGYNFLGIYDENDNLITTDTNYSFKIGLTNNYIAKFNYYTLSTFCKDSIFNNLYDNYNETKTSIGNNVVISAKEDNRCNWIGWYCDDKLITDQYSFIHTMKEENVIYEARYKTYLYQVNYHDGQELEKTIIHNAGIGKIQELTYTPKITRLGREFDGWYIGSNKITSNKTYTFTFSDENIENLLVLETKYKVCPEFSNFIFTSVSTHAIITDIIDKSVNEIIVPTNTSVINIFENMPNLKNVEFLSDSTLNENTFVNLPNLVQIKINGIAHIRTGAVKNCPKLCYVYLGRESKLIEKNSFVNCDLLNGVRIEKTYSDIFYYSTYIINTQKIISAYHNTSGFDCVFIPKEYLIYTWSLLKR